MVAPVAAVLVVVVILRKCLTEVAVLAVTMVLVKVVSVVAIKVAEAEVILTKTLLLIPGM